MDNVIRKVGRKIGVLYRCHRLLSNAARLAFVRSVIQPDLDYGAAVWADGSTGVISRLAQIQKRYLRCLAGLRYDDPLEELQHFSIDFVSIQSAQGTLLN